MEERRDTGSTTGVYIICYRWNVDGNAGGELVRRARRHRRRLSKRSELNNGILHFLYCGRHTEDYLSNTQSSGRFVFRSHRGRSGHVAEEIEVVDVLQGERRDEGERGRERETQ